MKTAVVRFKILSISAIPILCMVVLLITQQVLAQPSLKATHSIAVQKLAKNKKYKIKLFPSAMQDVLFFNATGVAGKVYQLFIFNMDGQLVKQAQVHNKQTTLLSDFLNGTYLFEVFSDDERIENGTICIR